MTFFGAGLTGTGGSLQANPDATIYACTNSLDRILAMDSPYEAGGLLAFDFDDGTTFHNSLSNGGVADIDGSFVATMPGMTVIADTSSLLPTGLEATSALGDSGGPAFIDFGNGPELVGLISWGVNPTNPANRYGSGLGDITYLTDLTPHHDWISGVIPEPTATPMLLAITCLTAALLHRRETRYKHGARFSEPTPKRCLRRRSWS